MTSLHVLITDAGGACSTLVLCWRGHSNAAADLTLIKMLQTQFLIPMWWKNCYLKEVLPACEDTVFLWCLLVVHKTGKLHTQDALPSQTSLLWIKVKKINLVVEKRHFEKGQFTFCFHNTRNKSRETEYFKGVEKTVDL